MAGKKGRSGRAPGRKLSAAEMRARRENAILAAAANKRDQFAEVFKDLPDPPEDPLALPGWTARIMAIVLKETLLGRGNEEIARTVRTTSSAIAKTIPFERIAQAERLIRGQQAPTRPTTATGPEMQPRDEVPTGPVPHRPVRG